MNPSIRASDADRQHAVEALQEHTIAGRLSLDEFTERVDAANRATTHGDLAALTADLPADLPADVPADVPVDPPARGGAIPGLLVAAVAVLALALLLGVAGLAGWGHMSTMMSAMTTTVGGCH